MTTYLKKAISLGPFRINLSKSGIGLSFGITGLRVGTGPKGPYIHAGRGGLYFRKSLKEAPNNQNEIVKEEVIESTEPQSIWKKIYIYSANFIVGMCILYLIIIIGLFYFMFSLMSYAAKDKRKAKIKR